MIRRNSQCGRLLAALSDGKWHSVPSIHRKIGTCRLNSRVAELRKHGYMIECERVPGRSGAAAYRYRLTGAPPAEWSGNGLLATLAAESEATGELPKVDGDNYAPRDARNRYRLYSLVGDDLRLVATCATPFAYGVAIDTLGREGEWDDGEFGLLDTHGTPDKPGEWIVKPWKEPLR